MQESGYDSDEEPPVPSWETNRLNWRLPASDSLSDWTIEIANGDSTVIDTYHVHRNMLAVGTKRSDYFIRLFQQDGFAESNSSTSRIQLEDVACESFPVFLDYLYSESIEKLNITTDNAAALHFLGQYFEVRRLRWEAKQFWQKDLSVENCGRYYAQSLLFHDEKLSRAVAELCVSHILEIDADNAIMETSDSQLWRYALAKTCPQISLHFSTLLAKFFTLRQDTVDKEEFLDLTRPEYLPEIHFDAALQLVYMEAKLLSPDLDGDLLSSLQLRCIKTLSKRWRVFETADNLKYDNLAKQSPPFLARLMEACLADSMSEIKTLTEALSKEKSENRSLRTSARCESADIDNTITEIAETIFNKEMEDALTEVVTTLSTSLAEERHENELLRDDISAAHNSLADAKHQIQDLQEHMEMEDALSEVVTSLSSSLAIERDENEALRGELSAAQKYVAAARYEIRELREQIDGLEIVQRDMKLLRPLPERALFPGIQDALSRDYPHRPSFDSKHDGSRMCFKGGPIYYYKKPERHPAKRWSMSTSPKRSMSTSPKSTSPKK